MDISISITPLVFSFLHTQNIKTPLTCPGGGAARLSTAGAVYCVYLSQVVKKRFAAPFTSINETVSPFLDCPFTTEAPEKKHTFYLRIQGETGRAADTQKVF